MAIYDRQAHKITVRVVYDGAAESGKTTNVREICGLFTVRKRGELIVPEESGGRTQYFDWLQLDTGLVGGYPLRCQIVTVPGQQSLRHRRDHILRSADVVVFVVDSSPDGMLDASRAHGELCTLLADTAADTGAVLPPVIVQANKQDMDDALHPDRVHVTLGLPVDATLVPASASEGQGVRETLVLAIRAAADRVQRDLLARGIDALEGIGESVDGLLEAMQESERLLQRRRAQPRTDRDVARILSWKPTEEDYVNAMAPYAWEGIESIEEVEADDAADLEDVAVDGTDERQCDVDEGGDDAAPATESTGRAPTRPYGQSPEFPDPLVPSGFIWPSTTGRLLLRDLMGQSFKARPDLVGRHGARDGSGTTDLLVYEAGPWFLKTSARRRFPTVDDARTALILLARKKVQLGDMLLPNTVLSLRPDTDGTVWLWTVAPRVATLRGEMVRADAAGDADALGEALGHFATAAVDALCLAREKQVLLDVHPGNFTHIDGQIVYIDDDIQEGPSIPLIGSLLLQRVQEYEHHPAAVEGYLNRLESEMARRLTGTDMMELDLAGELSDAPAMSAAVRSARARLQRLTGHRARGEAR